MCKTVEFAKRIWDALLDLIRDHGFTLSYCEEARCCSQCSELCFRCVKV